MRIAVAGLGKMGVMHASMFSAIPGAEVVALIDRDAGVRRQTRSMFGREVADRASAAECIAADRPDGVVVCTPQCAHRVLAEECLRAGVAVLTEKPLAHTLADAEAMAALARERPDVPAGVGFMLGFNPLFAEAARLVRAGAVGEPKAVRASCRLGQVFAPSKGWTFTKEAAGGGVLINSGSHLLFALLEILGPARSVVARAAPIHNAVEDALTAIVDFESGVWAGVDVSWSSPGYEFQTHDVAIEGTNGALEVGNETLRVWLSEPRDGCAKGWTERRRAETEPIAPFNLSPDYCGDEFYLEDADFVAAIRERRPPRVGWDKGLAVQRLLDAFYRAAASGAREAVARD